MSGLDTLTAQIPQELRGKLMQHFAIAKEYEKNRETISITYYCLMYIAGEAIKIHKDKQFAANVFDYLEATARNNSNDEVIKHQAFGQTNIEQLIKVLVNEANDIEKDQYKTPERLRLLMKKHYTIGGLTDVLSVFGTVKDDFLTFGKIAKIRAVSIFRELKAGGSGGAQAAIRPPDSNTDYNVRAVSPAKPPSNANARAISPSNDNIRPVSPLKPPSNSNARSVSPPNSDDTSNNRHDSSLMIPQAQKLCRYVISALDYDDIGTAVKYCEEVLRLLKPNNNE